MQFLWQYFEDMVGKGLEGWVLVQLLLYASASLVSMALPLAILLSSIMTFGNLGENYELVALKSSGISLQRIMRPLAILALFLSLIAFYFSNNILPVANLKFKSLLYDVMHQKPALDFKPGIFYGGIEGYVIRVKEKDLEDQTLKKVLIYDHHELNGNRKVIAADEGKMYLSPDERYLIFKLYNGYQYDEQKGKNRPLLRSEFDEHTINFDLSGFQFKRTDEDLFKDHYEMLSLGQLTESIDSLDLKRTERKVDFVNSMNQRMTVFNDSLNRLDTTTAAANAVTFMDSLPHATRLSLFATSVNLARSSKTFATAMAQELEARKKRIARHEIEWHRKFSLSIACILLFFIGAPMGAIIRKGGLGMPVVVSILFFLVYHIISISGEKLVKQLELEAWQGMWISSIVLIPIGAILTYKATTDSMLLDSTFYTRLTDKLARVFIDPIRSRLPRFKKKTA